jgi:hypothetical protein
MSGLKLEVLFPAWLTHMAADRSVSHYMGFSMGVLEFPHTIVIGFPYSE